MSRIVFYTNPMSRGRIVRWMLEELGEPYDTRVLDYGQQMKSPDYLAINPMGKVPTIQHGEAVVTEAAACCAYLASTFPDAGSGPGAGNTRECNLFALDVLCCRACRGGNHQHSFRF